MAQVAVLGCRAAQTDTAALSLQKGLSAENISVKLTVGEWSVVSDLKMPCSFYSCWLWTFVTFMTSETGVRVVGVLE